MKSNGMKPKNSIEVIDETFIWNRLSLKYPWFIQGGKPAWEILRAYYYTYFTGSEEIISKYTRKIKRIAVSQSVAPTLTPVIFKKQHSERAVKGDDIALAVDALHHAYNRNIDIVHIFTGDGDFVPLINEIKQLGITVFISAFSSGLNPKIEECADAFFNLDSEFFE